MIGKTTKAKLEMMRKARVRTTIRARVGKTIRARHEVAIGTGVETRNRREAEAEQSVSRSSRTHITVLYCPSYRVLSF
jgi:L-fucose isomerase-like protein